MRFIIPWILVSGLIGYLGRNRRGGFWGSFFFSLVFSPLLGGLALIIGGPGAAQKKAAIEAAGGTRRQRRRAASGESVHLGAGLLTRVLLPWVVLIAVFTGVYAFMVEDGVQSAFFLSLDVGTLGFAGLHRLSADIGARVRLAAALHRFLVLLVFSGAILHVLRAWHEARLRTETDRLRAEITSATPAPAASATSAAPQA